MDEIGTLTGLAAAPVITAIVAAIGAAVPALPRRAYPLLAVALGVTWNVAVRAALRELDWAAPIVGVVAGLAASGLYSGAVKPVVAALRTDGDVARN
jgi:hypothetical protein